ncbi:hypothetical protein HDU91_001382, partial [Kappamyces sp. JEL0680]
MENVMECLESYLLQRATSQEELLSIVTAISASTWQQLRQDYEMYPQYHSILTRLAALLRSKDSAPYQTKSSEELGLTWHSAAITTQCPDLVVRCWMHLLKKKGCSEDTKLRFVQSIEGALDSREKRQTRDTVQRVLEILRNDALPPLLKDEALDQVKLAYFALINMAHRNKRSLFRTNVEIVYHLQSYDAVEAELDEGEIEEGAINERMDDVSAANYLFSSVYSSLLGASGVASLIPELPPLGSPSSNILLGREMTALLPRSPGRRKEAIDVLYGVWKKLADSMPPAVFRQSLLQAIKSRFSAPSPACLFDAVFVEHFFSQVWIMKEYNAAVLSLISESSLGEKEPFSLFFEYLAALPNDTLPKSHPAFVFLLELSKEAAIKLSSVIIPASRSGKGGKGGKVAPFGFLESPEFPKTLMVFLHACLENSPENVLHSYFGQLVAEMKLGRADSSHANVGNPYETVFISLLALQGSAKLADAAMIPLFIEPGGSRRAVSHNFFKVGSGQVLIQEYLNSPDNLTRPQPQHIQHLLLSAQFRANKVVFNHFKDLTALSEPGSFAEKVLTMSLSSHHSALTWKPKCTVEMVNLFNANGSHERTGHFIEIWETYLYDVHPHCNLLLMSLYSSELPQRLKTMVRKHVMKHV